MIDPGVKNIIVIMVTETITIPGTLLDYWELTLTMIGILLAAVSFKRIFR